MAQALLSFNNIHPKKESNYMNSKETMLDFSEIPSALSEKAQLIELFSKLNVFLFLDFDGTLSPIVNHPEDAEMSDDMRKTLNELSSKIHVGIISGRDLDDLADRVGIDSVIYAGSHGFRIKGPSGLNRETKDSKRLSSKFQRIYKELKDFFDKEVSGVEIERKRYAIAIHYRNASENASGLITPKVNEILKKNPDFKKGTGKKIIEIKPDVDWHKGKALLWILDAMNKKEDPDTLPIYIGDDLTDEDAFKTLTDKGLGILVADHGHKTAADYHLKDVDEVLLFLKILVRNVRPVGERIKEE